MKSLNGAELAGYIKENQAHLAQGLLARGVKPKLVIIRNSNSPVIEKYVSLKKSYGEDIGVEVEDWLREDLNAAVVEANARNDIHGVIVQLPLEGDTNVESIVNSLAPAKDVDGLGEKAEFDSATATAINWLLAGYNIDLTGMSIALVGHGRLVGGPLEKMWRDSGYQVKTFRRGDDLSELKSFDIVVSATGVPHLVKSGMVKVGAVVVDAGTASEGGVLVGDIDDSVRERTDLTAITPKIGGVGPLTVTALFEHVLAAAQKEV